MTSQRTPQRRAALDPPYDRWHFERGESSAVLASRRLAAGEVALEETDHFLLVSRTGLIEQIAIPRARAEPQFGVSRTAGEQLLRLARRRVRVFRARHE